MSNKLNYYIYYSKHSFEHWLTAAAYIHALQSKRTSLDSYKIIPIGVEGDGLSEALNITMDEADRVFIIGKEAKMYTCYGVYRANWTSTNSPVKHWAAHTVSPPKLSPTTNHITCLAKDGIISLPYAVFMISNNMTFHEDNHGISVIVRAIEAYFRFRYNMTGYLNPDYEKIIIKLTKIFSLYSPSSSQAQALFSFYDTKSLKQYMKNLLEIAGKNQQMKEFMKGEPTIKPEFLFNSETCLTTGQPQKRYAEAIPLPEAKLIADRITPNVVDQKIVEFILPQFILEASIGNGSPTVLHFHALYVDCNGTDFIHDPVKYAELNNYKVDVVVEELFKPRNPDSLSYRVTWTDKGVDDYLHMGYDYIPNTNIPMVAVPFNMLSEDDTRNILHYIFRTMDRENNTWESARTIFKLADDDYDSPTEIIGYIDIKGNTFSVTRVQHGPMCHILFNPVVRGQLPDDEASDNAEEGKDIDDGNPVVGEESIECEVSPKSMLDRINDDVILQHLQSLSIKAHRCPTVDWDTYVQILNINFPQIVHYRCEGIGMGSIEVPVQTCLDRVAVVDVDRMPEADRECYRINKREYITQITGERIYGLIEMWTENENVKHFIHLNHIDNNPLHWSGPNWTRLTEEATKVLTAELNSYSTGVTRTLSGKAVDISTEVGSEVFYLFVENVPIKAYIVRSFDDVIINFISDNDQEPTSLPPSIPIKEMRKLSDVNVVETDDINDVPDSIPVIDRIKRLNLLFPQFIMISDEGKHKPFEISDIIICDFTDMDVKLNMCKVMEWVSTKVTHNDNFSGVIRITKSSRDGMFRHSMFSDRYWFGWNLRCTDRNIGIEKVKAIVDYFSEYADSRSSRRAGFVLDNKLVDTDADFIEYTKHLTFHDPADGIIINITIAIDGSNATITFE